MPLLTLLPLLSWILLVLCYRRTELDAERPWRSAFLVASVFWSTLLVLLTEVLSLLHALNRTGLAVSWALICVLLAAFYFLRKSGDAAKSFSTTRRPSLNLSLFQKCAISIMLLQAILLAMVALHYRPNTFDSMTYHMSRVMHWSQNQSVSNYATNIERQVYLPPFAEFVLAHFQILSGGERLANLVQWFSWILSTVAVSLIAAQLGAKRNGVVAASLIAASIPMGVLQATSTQNDFVLTACLCCFVYFGIFLMQHPRNKFAVAAVGLSLGLSLLTKQVAYLIGFSFCIWFGANLLIKNKWRGLVTGSLIFVLALSLNAGHFFRQIQLYDFIYSEKMGAQYSNEEHSPAVLASNMIRNAGLHVTLQEGKKWQRFWGNSIILTVVKGINKFNLDALQWIHDFTGLSPTDPKTTYASSGDFKLLRDPFHEDFAGNPFHLLLILATCAVLFFRFLIPGSGKADPILAIYVLSLVAAYVLFSLYLRWQEWGSRLMLPLFVLWCPAIARVLVPSDRRIFLAIPLIIGLLSFDWIHRNTNRPLTSQVFSFRQSGIETYFSSNPVPLPMYNEIIQKITNDRCHNIGLAIHGNSYEYPLWGMLAEKSYPATIQYMEANNPTRIFLDPLFRPCAVIYIKPSFQRPDAYSVQFPTEK